MDKQASRMMQSFTIDMVLIILIRKNSSRANAKSAHSFPIQTAGDDGSHAKENV